MRTAVLVAIGTSWLGITPAHAFQDDRFTIAQIAEALRPEIARWGWGDPDRIIGFGLERLVAASRGGQVNLNRWDRWIDVFTPEGGIQVKSGVSPTAIYGICNDLRTGRYARFRMVLANDAYAKVVGRCGVLVSETVEQAGVSKAAMLAVLQRLQINARFLRALPYAGAGVTIATVGWEIYAVASDPAHAVAAVGRDVFTMAGATGTTLGVAAAIPLAFPAVPVAVPILAGAATGAGVSYAIIETGVGEMVGEQTARATGWVIDQSKAAWGWVRSVFE